MTKTQFRKKSKELKREVSKLIDDRIEKILNSGCIDLTAYGDTYELPKAFISAMGQEIKFQFKPFNDDLKKESENIEHFL